MHDVTRRTRRRDHRRVEDDAAPAVLRITCAQSSACRAWTLRRQVADDAIGDAEQLQRLIDEVRAEIVPKAGADARPFPPPVANDQPVSIEVRFDVRDLAECAARQEIVIARKSPSHRRLWNTAQHAALAPGQ